METPSPTENYIFLARHEPSEVWLFWAVEPAELAGARDIAYAAVQVYQALMQEGFYRPDMHIVVIHQLSGELYPVVVSKAGDKYLTFPPDELAKFVTRALAEKRDPAGKILVLTTVYKRSAETVELNRVLCTELQLSGEIAGMIAAMGKERLPTLAPVTRAMTTKPVP